VELLTARRAALLAAVALPVLAVACIQPPPSPGAGCLLPLRDQICAPALPPGGVLERCGLYLGPLGTDGGPAPYGQGWRAHAADGGPSPCARDEIALDLDDPYGALPALRERRALLCDVNDGACPPSRDPSVKLARKCQTETPELTVPRASSAPSLATDGETLVAVAPRTMTQLEITMIEPGTGAITYPGPAGAAPLLWSAPRLGPDGCAHVLVLRRDPEDASARQLTRVRTGVHCTQHAQTLCADTDPQQPQDVLDSLVGLDLAFDADGTAHAALTLDCSLASGNAAATCPGDGPLWIQLPDPDQVATVDICDTIRSPSVLPSNLRPLLGVDLLSMPAPGHPAVLATVVELGDNGPEVTARIFDSPGEDGALDLTQGEPAVSRVSGPASVAGEPGDASHQPAVAAGAGGAVVVLADRVAGVLYTRFSVANGRWSVSNSLIEPPTDMTIGGGAVTGGATPSVALDRDSPDASSFAICRAGLDPNRVPVPIVSAVVNDQLVGHVDLSRATATDGSCAVAAAPSSYFVAVFNTAGGPNWLGWTQSSSGIVSDGVPSSLNLNLGQLRDLQVAYDAPGSRGQIGPRFVLLVGFAQSDSGGGPQYSAYRFGPGASVTGIATPVLPQGTFRGRPRLRTSSDGTVYVEYVGGTHPYGYVQVLSSPLPGLGVATTVDLTSDRCSSAVATVATVAMRQDATTVKLLVTAAARQGPYVLPGAASPNCAQVGSSSAVEGAWLTVAGATAGTNVVRRLRARATATTGPVSALASAYRGQDRGVLGVPSTAAGGESALVLAAGNAPDERSVVLADLGTGVRSPIALVLPEAAGGGSGLAVFLSGGQLSARPFALDQPAGDPGGTDVTVVPFLPESRGAAPVNDAPQVVDAGDDSLIVSYCRNLATGWTRFALPTDLRGQPLGPLTLLGPQNNGGHLSCPPSTLVAARGGDGVVRILASTVSADGGLIQPLTCTTAQVAATQSTSVDQVATSAPAVLDGGTP
jgi:hypothetical protein